MQTKYNRQESAYVRGIIEILVTIGTKMPTVILENSSQQLIQLMPYFLSHQNLNYSLLVFDFLNQFRQILTDIDNKQFLQDSSYDYLFQAYATCQGIVISQCEQRFRPLSEFEGTVSLVEGRVTVMGRQVGEEVEGEEKEQIVEYRSYAEDALFSIFHVLSTFRGEEGVSLFYQ